MKRYGKIFHEGYWLDAAWWHPEADYDAVAAKVDEAQNAAVTLSLKLGAAEARVAELETKLDRYRRTLYQANGNLIMRGVEPIKLVSPEGQVPPADPVSPSDLMSRLESLEMNVRDHEAALGRLGAFDEKPIEETGNGG